MWTSHNLGCLHIFKQFTRANRHRWTIWINTGVEYSRSLLSGTSNTLLGECESCAEIHEERWLPWSLWCSSPLGLPDTAIRYMSEVKTQMEHAPWPTPFANQLCTGYDKNTARTMEPVRIMLNHRCADIWESLPSDWLQELVTGLMIIGSSPHRWLVHGWVTWWEGHSIRKAWKMLYM